MMQEQHVVQIAIVGLEAQLARHSNRCVERIDRIGRHDHAARKVGGVGLQP